MIGTLSQSGASQPAAQAPRSGEAEELTHCARANQSDLGAAQRSELESSESPRGLAEPELSNIENVSGSDVPQFTSHPIPDTDIHQAAEEDPSDAEPVTADNSNNICVCCANDEPLAAVQPRQWSQVRQAAAQVNRSELYDIAGFLRSQLWLGCYRGPPPLVVDLFIIISLYSMGWDAQSGQQYKQKQELPSLAAGLLATRTATTHEALPGCLWMGNLSVMGSVGRARLEAHECLGAHACGVHACGSAGRSGCSVEETAVQGEDFGRWIHLREWFEEVQKRSGGKVAELGADFVLVRSHGETVLGRAAAELWISQNEGMHLCSVLL